MFSSPPLFISTRNNVVAPKFRRRDGTAVDRATIEAFRHGFQGQVLLPGDAGYSSARRIWNASIDKHPGLIVGGGGNFGIVTSFLFQAHPVSTVLGGVIVHARPQAAAVFCYYRDFMASAPEELTAYAGLISTPEGMPAVAVMACYCGDLAEGERVLKPLRAFGSPLLDAIQPMPFPIMQTLADEANPDNIHNYWKSTLLNELSDEAIDLIFEHGNLAGYPLTHVLIQLFNGQVSRVGNADTAFAQRQAGYNVGIEAKWIDPAESEKHITWARAFSDALKPYSPNATLLHYLAAQ